MHTRHLHKTKAFQHHRIDPFIFTEDRTQYTWQQQKQLLNAQSQSENTHKKIIIKGKKLLHMSTGISDIDRVTIESKKNMKKRRINIDEKEILSAI